MANISPGQLYEDGEFESLATTGIEEEAMLNVTIKAMYDELKDEDDHCIDIFSLMINKHRREKSLSNLVFHKVQSADTSREFATILKSSNNHNGTAMSRDAPWWCFLLTI